jgi:hypothetical protein
VLRYGNGYGIPRESEHAHSTRLGQFGNTEWKVRDGIGDSFHKQYPASGNFQRASLMGVSPVFTSTIEFLDLDVLQYDVPPAWVEFHLFRSPAGTSTLVT